MKEIAINTTIDVVTKVQMTITRARTTFLGVALQSGFLYLVFEYLNISGDVVKKRFFKVKGGTYATKMDTIVQSKSLALVLQKGADNFAMELVNNPSVIDGNDVEEIDAGMLSQDLFDKLLM